MKYMLFVIQFLIPFLVAGVSMAQDSCLAVHLYIGEKTIVPIRDSGAKNFFLLRDAVYEFELVSGRRYTARVTGIKHDTIAFTNYINLSHAKRFNSSLDTLTIPLRQISRFYFLTDKVLGMKKDIPLSDYTIDYTHDCERQRAVTSMEQIYTNDTTKYEILPYLTAFNFSAIFIENGNIYYYSGNGYEKDLTTDSTYTVKNVAWFTPSYADEINGLALGLFAMNLNESRSLTIRGVHIELQPFGFIWVLGRTIFDYPEQTLSAREEALKEKQDLRVSGFNLSVSGICRKAHLSGVNIGGLSTTVNVLHGVSISGINNFAYDMKGISIAALHNVAVQGRGVQIGLFNTSKDFKGLQIGLWNNNGKFSLPLINFRL
jgi:hypothetical protein